MSRLYSVDRIEDDQVVLIRGDGTSFGAAVTEFAEPPREGDVVYRYKGLFRRSKKKTAEKRDVANALLAEILNNSKDQ